jgi:hypothetical protein
MPPVEFDQTTPTDELPQIYALDRVVTGTSRILNLPTKNSFDGRAGVRLPTGGGVQVVDHTYLL